MNYVALTTSVNCSRLLNHNFSYVYCIVSELQEIFMVTCAEKLVNGGSKLIYKIYCTVKLCAENPMLSIIILKACAQRFRYALFAFIHTQTYFEYYTLTLRLASLVKRAVIYAYWTMELFDICRENVSHMATLPSVAKHVIHADNLGPHH